MLSSTSVRYEVYSIQLVCLSFDVRKVLSSDTSITTEAKWNILVDHDLEQAQSRGRVKSINGIMNELS